MIQRLLRLSLFAKILIANSAIVCLGAISGVLVVHWQQEHPSEANGYGAVMLFALLALGLSLTANAIVLRTAFLPLQRLERVARRVAAGDLAARAKLGLLGDPETDQLATSFNVMLDHLEDHAREVEAYSRRLHELSDRALVAQEEERHRISRELHDEIGQQLSVLLLSLRLFRDAVDADRVDAAAVRSQAIELSELVRETVGAVRKLALDLHPRMVDDLGLAAALKECVGDWSRRNAIPSTFTTLLDCEQPMSADAQIALYRMVQETLANVAKHAHATHVSVTLCRDGGGVRVTVHDNGAGAGPDGFATGLGLFATRERVALVGGQFTVSSTPGEGTIATALVPLSRSEEPSAVSAGAALPPVPSSNHSMGDGAAQLGSTPAPMVPMTLLASADAT